MSYRDITAGAILVLMTGLAGGVAAQEPTPSPSPSPTPRSQTASPQTEPQQKPRTAPQPAPGQMSQQAQPKLTATLVDQEKKAQENAATVEVKVTGVQMVDPAKTGERKQRNQAHLHYKVDDGPIIATTATKLSFHELTPGEHTIVVMLAANDHSPLGPQQTLRVVIPEGSEPRAGRR